VSNQIQPHDIVEGTRRRDSDTLTGRRGDAKTVTKGLIVTEERNMEEIRVGLCSKPISFSQESAGVGFRIFTCHLCIGRLGVYI